MTMDAIERRNLAEILKHDALHSSIDRDDMLSCHSSKKGDRRELSPADSLVCCATPEPLAHNQIIKCFLPFLVAYLNLSRLMNNNRQQI